MAMTVKQARSLADAAGETIYHVISLQPDGYVVVAADDEVEPILAFAARGRFEASEENPLFSLLQRDVAGRLHAVRAGGKSGGTRDAGVAGAQRRLQATRRWNRLAHDGVGIFSSNGGPQTESHVPAVSDLRVAPLVQSTWNQGTVAGLTCYNYYTPGNYVSGCVATMMAQLMRYYQWPSVGVGTLPYSITVDGVVQLRSLRGGNGAGGPYNWSQMVLNPNGSIALAQRQMIGAVCHDAGVSVNMSYTPYSSSSSVLTAADRLAGVFGYANTVKGYNGGNNIGAAMNAMMHPSLDAGFPVMLGIRRDGGGHAVLCDGYGYQSGTLYHHLNMGWDGVSDAWYNLPDIDALFQYTSVDTCIYNIYPQGGGEIISGRVLDTNGIPVAGVAVSAAGPNALTAYTDARGIYALVHATPNSYYTVSLDDPVYAETNRTVLVGRSYDYGSGTGNRDGIDFTALPAVIPNRAPVLAALPDRGVQAGELLEFAVSATDPDGDVPTLSAPIIPSGASFTNYGDGTGLFSWTPGSGDVGSHAVRIVASDGERSDTNDLTVAVSTFAVTEPVDGHTVRGDASLQVAWDGPAPLGAVDIDLWCNGASVMALTNRVPSLETDMVINVILPRSAACSPGYRVRVSVSAAPQNFSDSGTFTIVPTDRSWLTLLLD